MNNLSSYCGLVDAKIRASDKDLPVLYANGSIVNLLTYSKFTYCDFLLIDLLRLYNIKCLIYLKLFTGVMQWKLTYWLMLLPESVIHTYMQDWLNLLMRILANFPAIAVTKLKMTKSH